ATLKSKTFKCYVCATDNQHCDNPVGHNVPTLDGFMSCLTYYYESGGDSTVLRSGSIFQIDDQCNTVTIDTMDEKMLNNTAVSSLKSHLRSSDKIKACACNSDLCNGAPTNTGTMMIFAAVPLIIQHLLQ
ncbi:unnamed protein product, partial [Meganyctiphanes norvegica]